MMRTTLLAATWGIILLFGANHASAEDPSSPFLKLCEADGNAADTQLRMDQPRDLRPKKKVKPETTRSAEDVALSERFRARIANKLQQYVTRPQDRTAVEAFYRGRDFAPLWVNARGLLPATQQVIDFLHGVAADGLDPRDYPTPTFADRSPERLATDELALTNSVVTFVRHAGTGRVAYSRVSGSIYFDLKSPDLQQVLEIIASSHDIAATLDSFNPQQPQYRELKAALARAREKGDGVIPATTNKIQRAHQNGGSQAKVPAARIDAILANMERWRRLPRELGTAYVMVNLPGYTLTVMKDGKPVWSTRIVVGQPGKHATPLLAGDDKVHHVQSDVECTAFHYPKRIPSGSRPRSYSPRAHWPENWPQQRWLNPNISTT